MKICDYCLSEIPNRNKRFCSLQCTGFARRGKRYGNFDAPEKSAKRHCYITIGKDLFNQPIRKYLHRFEVEMLIRPLREKEIVHHIDGDIHNNDLENLEILANQAEHLARHNYHRVYKVSDEMADCPF